MTLNLDGLTSVLWTQLWQVTLLIPLAIGLVRGVCRGRSHLGYAVLLAVLVKCLVPPLWSSPASMFSWASHALSIWEDSTAAVVDVPSRDAQSATRESTTNSNAIVPGAESSVTVDVVSPGLSSEGLAPQLPVPRGEDDPDAVRIIDWPQVGVVVLLGGWLCGIVGVSGYLLAKRAFIEQFHDDTRVVTQADLLSILTECATALDLRRRPDLVVTNHPTIPFVVGWWSPRLVIPKHMVDRSTIDDMRLIIAHELNHLRRWDTATNWIQLGIQAVWWFHPGVWWLNAEIRRWRESCCDEEVVARLKCPPASYAHCLLNVLDFQASLRSTSGLDSLSPYEVTKQRLQNIMQPVGPFPRSTPWPVWLVFVALTFIVLPGAAFRIPPQIADAHDEIPQSPLELAIPPAPPVATTITPAEVLPANRTLPSSTPDAPPASPWQYKFDVHRPYQYSVLIEEETLQGTTRHTGQPVVRATYVSGGEWSLNITNPELMSTETPSPGSPFGPGFRPPRIPNPFDRGYEVTIDSQGRSLEEAGDAPLPLFLGRWSNWLFGPLPTGNHPATWNEEGDTSLSIMIEPTHGPFGTPSRSPFARPVESSRLAATTHEQTTQSAENGVLTLVKQRTVQTQNLVDGQPSLEIESNSTWSFNSRMGVPVSLIGTGMLIQRQAQQSTKTPFKFAVQLQDQDLAKPAGEAPEGQATDEPSAPHTDSPLVTHIGEPVPPQKKLERGQKFVVEWNGSWFPGEVIEVPSTNDVKIHYPGWSDHWDEVVPRNRLRYPSTEPSAK